MKIKVLLLALGCTMGTLGAYAQKGVDNGTQFGSGEDSVRCITNISLFVPYAKAGNFKDAFDFCTMSVLPLQKISICTV